MKLELLLAVKQGLLTPDQDLVWLETDRPGKIDFLSEHALLFDRDRVEKELGISRHLFDRIFPEIRDLFLLNSRYHKENS